MKKLFLDFETRSAVDIKRVGAFKYAMHPSTEIMCMAVHDDTTPKVRVLKPWELPNCRALDRDFSTYQLTAHNAHFEYAVWNYILHKRFGWPALWDPKYWGCTLARAAMCNLPIGLGECGAALGIKAEKDMMGRSAMLKLSKPISVDALGLPMYREDEDLKQILYKYCAQDVEAEMEIDSRLPELPPNERKIWELDLKMNHRGMRADVEVATKGMVLAEAITTDLNGRLNHLTNGAVDKASRSAAICRWLTAQGVSVPTKKNAKKEIKQTIDKVALASLLAHPEVLPPLAREVLSIRQQVGKSSTSKYEKIIDFAGDGDRMRGMLQYHAAGTGRWGGRGPQPQNFPKGIGYNSDAVCEDILNLSVAEFRAKYKEKAMDALSAALRGCMTASPGKVLAVADYSGIEVCTLMWMAGEEDALKYLRGGKNLYIPMAEHIYHKTGLSKEGNPKEYAVGKEVILGAGYQMWWIRFMEECKKKGIKLGSSKLTDQVMNYEEEGEQTEEEVALCLTPEKRSKDRYMTEEEVEYRDSILAYREKYPKVRALWGNMEKAAVAAVRSPGKNYVVEGTNPAVRIIWGMDPKREFLVCRLPSGRHLRYYHPFLKTKVNRWGKEKVSLHFYGEDTKTHQWGVLHTYGGKLTENVNQGIARDFMANGMLNTEAAGFEMLITVHDEPVAETDAPMAGDTELGSYEENLKQSAADKLNQMIAAMCDLSTIPWGAGCPISAKGFVGFRYRKD